MRHALPIFLGTLAAAAFFPTGLAASDPVVTVVMTRLDNPRGLAFGPGGALFVAEAGRGGAPCPPAGGALNCYGLTGAVSRLWHGRQDRIVTGLPSVSFPQGASARGPHDIAMRFGTGAGSSVLGVGGAHVTIGLEADPATRSALDRPDLGKLVHIPTRALLAPSTHLCDQDCWSPVVDIAAFEIGGGPDSGVPESDPYGLLVERRGEGAGDDEEFEDVEDGKGGDVVVDASGNSLLRVDEDGEISLLAVFPSRSTVPPRPVPAGVTLTDSVPTSVAVGPDGAYYVGELAGIPFTGPKRDRSNIYRVAAGQDPYHPTVFLDGHVTGFNAIIDIAFKGQDLYVLQHWTIVADGDAQGREAHPRGLRWLALSSATASRRRSSTDSTGRPRSSSARTARCTSPTTARLPAFVGGVYTPIGEVLRIDVGDDAPDGRDGHRDDEDR